MAKLDELWDPVPRRLIADLRTEQWTTERPASNVDAWVWAFRQIDEGAVPSVRDLCAFAGWGNRRAARMLDEVIAGWNEWSGKQAARQEQHHARKRIYSAPTAHLPRTSSAPPTHLSESVKAEIVEEERTSSAPPQHLPRTSSASTPHRRARSSLREESDTKATGEESGSPDLVPSPPPAEPSGSPADLWSKAADLAEGGSPRAEIEPPSADPEAWRASEEFQPSTNAYVFDDAEPVGASEQPSDPRQIESPDHDSFDPASMVLPRTVGANPQRYTLHAVKADAKATPDVASTSPADERPSPERSSNVHPATRAPEAPPQGPRPSPTRQGNGEGDPGGATVAQDAPSLFGRTDTAHEASAPAKAPQRARKATAADKAADALAVYGAWRVYHPRAAETPTPDATKLLGRLLVEAGGLDGALLLMEWAHVGTCERARQLRGEHPWPDGRRTVYTDLGSLSRHVASRLEMAHDWKDRSTDKDTGLKVLHVPETPRVPFRGRDTTNAMNVLGNIVRKDLEARNVL